MIFDPQVVGWILGVLAIAGLGVLLWWVLYKSSDDIRRKGLGLPERSGSAPAPAPPARVHAPPPAAPAGWYSVPGGKCYWNGREWTTPVIPG